MISPKITLAILSLVAVTSAVADRSTLDETETRAEQPERPPLPPLVRSLDADHDGELSASEIANAPAALATLDQNNDGKLTHDELRSPHPHSPPPRGERGPDGPPPPEGPGGPGGPRRPRD